MSINYSGHGFKNEDDEENKPSRQDEIIYTRESDTYSYKTPPKKIRKFDEEQRRPSTEIFCHEEAYQRIIKLLRTGNYNEKIAPVDIWDFGGQDIYYVTHQLFICYRGTFILVFDGSKDLNEHMPVKSYLPGLSELPTIAIYLLHWVNSILTFCKQSSEHNRNYPKILLVATHKDLIPKGMVEKRRREIVRQLENLFKNHSGEQHLIYHPLVFLTTTDEQDNELVFLKQQIISIAFTHPSFGHVMPTFWIPLEIRIL